MLPRVEIVAVGSELLTPERVDTNSLWLTEQLNELGFEVRAKAIVGDDLERLTQAIEEALRGAELVITTGGLGPTEDDLTRDAASRALQRALQPREDLWQELQAKFARLGRPLPENNRRQTLVLEGAQVLPNPRGTAPGQCCELSEDSMVVLLPGPPRELKPMFVDHLRSRLAARGGGRVLVRSLLKVVGLGESAMDELLLPVYAQFPEIRVTTLFTELDLEVHLNAAAESEAQARAMLAPMEKAVEQALGRHVYARGPMTLAQVVGDLLRQRQASLVTAESLTGGMVAQRVTAVAGSSQYFLGSWVTYSDAMKRELGVPADVLEAHGAVSAPVAEAMASAARGRSGADFALSLTGVAGPDGGSQETPVGTVYLGLACESGTCSKRVTFPGDREGVRSRAAQAALDWLRRSLLDEA